MTKTGKYIYGIIPQAKKFIGSVPFFPEIAVQAKQEKENISSQECLLQETIKTLSHGGDKILGRLDVIPYKDIAAVVSEVETSDYANLPKELLAGLLVKHQKIIEKIMSFDYLVIPVKFGTSALDEGEVKDILHKGYSLIKEILKKINNKIEINVAATWSDFTSVLKEAGEEEEIRELKTKLLANPASITRGKQMKIGQMMKKTLDEKRNKYAFQIQEALKSGIYDFKDHEFMDDKMVANMAFLIDKAKQKDFDKKLEKLNTQMVEKLHFRRIGPLPPYSFYTLEIKKIPFEKIDWARKQFALSKAADKKEIKKAYQQASLSLHPDISPNKPHAEKKFQDIVKAYKILLDYCQAYEQMGGSDACSFQKEEFTKNAILVRLSGGR